MSVRRLRLGLVTAPTVFMTHSTGSASAMLHMTHRPLLKHAASAARGPMLCSFGGAAPIPD